METYLMIRKQWYLTKKQDAVLKKLKKEYDLPITEIIRRVLDYFINNEDIRKIVTMEIINKKDYDK